jgi:hypothetical protein
MATDLFQHPFLTATSERALPTLLAAWQHVRRNADHERKAQRENWARLNPADRYATTVLRRTQGLYDTLRVLEDARRLIGVFPTQLGKGSSAISRDRWVDYHYGYFTVALASLPDIGIVLTSTVYRLGLAYKHCTADVVTSHARIKGTSIAQSLRELSKSVQEVKERRNRHVHRGEHADVESLSPSSFLRDLKALTFLRNVNPALVDAAFIAEGWRYARNEIAPRLEKEEENVKEVLALLLNNLLPVYRSTVELLSSLTSEPPPPVGQ